MDVFWSTVCLSVLSVTLVYCGQTVGWIKIPFGTEVGLTTQATLCYMGTQFPRKKGHSIPQFSANICCGQTAGWITMPLGMEVDLGPGDIALDGDPAPPPPPPARKGGTAPLILAHVLSPNGLMDQHATWYGDRPRPWPHCVRRGPSKPPKGHSPPIFGPYLLWPNGWMDQDATWCCVAVNIQVCPAVNFIKFWY